MDKMQKQMYVQVLNLNTGKMFSLPTLYTDRVEACVCGQNYVRDRQAEDPRSMLFFRVLNVRENGETAPVYYLWGNEDEELHPICNHDEDDCDGECECCGLCSEDSEEPDYRELIEGILEVCEEFGVNLVVPRT